MRMLSEALPPRPHSRSTFYQRSGANVELLFFVFGPLLLLIVLICADARGGSAVEAAGRNSQNGLRYVLLASFMVTFIGLMVSLAK